MRAAMPFKWGGLLAVLTVAACTSNPSAPLPEPQVDLDRYMGDWYVLASIPTPLETKAYDAIERYRLADDGTVETTFTYSNGSHDGEQREYTATGFVTEDPSNAVWEMQFLWPFRADYRVLHVDPDYQVTVIGREKRDFAWIMARTPQLPDAQYATLVELLRDVGYDDESLADLREIPH